MRRLPSLSLGKSGGGLHHSFNDIRRRAANDDLTTRLRLLCIIVDQVPSVKMKFSAKSGAIAFSALAVGQAAADDVLYSRHLGKRQLGSEGNYNISQ